jgi:hypothetical protein
MRAGLAAALLLGSTASAQEAPVVVRLGDGTTLPMASWSLAYEYASWRQGDSPALGRTESKEARELWVGKKDYPVAGSELAFEHDVVEKSVEEMDGATTTKRVPVVRGLVLTDASGRQTRLKPEAPSRDHFLPTDKSRVFQARSLEIRGQTLTGTRRSFCLLSYTALVQCTDSVGQEVVKLEFPK